MGNVCILGVLGFWQKIQLAACSPTLPRSARHPADAEVKIELTGKGLWGSVVSSTTVRGGAFARDLHQRPIISREIELAEAEGGPR